MTDSGCKETKIDSNFNSFFSASNNSSISMFELKSMTSLIAKVNNTLKASTLKGISLHNNRNNNSKKESAYDIFHRK